MRRSPAGGEQAAGEGPGLEVPGELRRARRSVEDHEQEGEGVVGED